MVKLSSLHTARRPLLSQFNQPILVCSGIILCVCVTLVSIAAYYEYTDNIRSSPTLANKAVDHTVSLMRQDVSQITHQPKSMTCFILTMNTSLPAVQLSPEVTCYPFLGSRVTDDIFALVSPHIQANLMSNISSWGADFTNNVSVSIAYNHMQLWRRLAHSSHDSDMLIFEDDILIDKHALALYQKIARSGVLPRQNYILKLANRYRMNWLGSGELSSIFQFVQDSRQYMLQKCVCRTRQNFFSSAAYVLDRHAARILLQHHIPMQMHVDIFMHYVGCRFSNFFLLDVNAVTFSMRPSTHQTEAEESYRLVAAFKEQIKSILFTSCW